MDTDIYSFARQVANTYETGTITSDNKPEFSMFERIRENEFLSSSRYLSGDYDENSDLKPFHDIITRILENQRNAEEIDTKDLKTATDDPEYYTRAMLLDKFNQDWLKKNRIDKFLNDAIETRGKHGGLLVKIIEETDNIDLEVCDWTNFAGDIADLESGIKVFSHFYTPAKLLEVAKERGWDLDEARSAIKLYAEENQNEDTKDDRKTSGEYILVREVSGVLPKTYIDPDAEEHEYSYQLHYIAGAEFQDPEGKEKGVTLASNELKQSPYYYLPYKKRSSTGKELGIGMVEKARHAQIQTNVGAQNYADAMAFASTHILQSSSKNLKGKNVLTNMTKGTILKTDDGKPVTGVDMSPQALAHVRGYLEEWRTQLDRATGTFAVATGENLPAGTPYRLGAIMDQNAQSSFDLRREEMGIFLNQIYQERIFPFFIKQMRKEKVLALKFSPEELRKLDQDVSSYQADSYVIDRYLSGMYDSLPAPLRFVFMEMERDDYVEEVKSELHKGKSRRKITDFPEDYWANADEKFYVDVTGENRDKKSVLETVTNVLIQYLQFKPALDADPEARKLFNQIVATAGLEPIDFTTPDDGNPEQQQPAQGGPAKGQPERTAIDSPELLSAKPE